MTSATEGVRVMSEYRNIESMLLSDNMLLRLCNEADKPDRLEAIKAAQDKELATNAGKHAGDDLKPTAQAVHQAIKKELKLTRSGETKHAFMRDCARTVGDGRHAGISTAEK